MWSITLQSLSVFDAFCSQLAIFLFPCTQAPSSLALAVETLLLPELSVKLKIVFDITVVLLHASSSWRSEAHDSISCRSCSTRPLVVKVVMSSTNALLVWRPGGG